MLYFPYFSLRMLSFQLIFTTSVLNPQCTIQILRFFYSQSTTATFGNVAQPNASVRALKIPSWVARTTQCRNFPALSPPSLGSKQLLLCFLARQKWFCCLVFEEHCVSTACLSSVLWIAFRSTPSARRRRTHPFNREEINASHAQYSCVFLHTRAINFQWHPLCVFMLPPTSPFFTRGLLSLAPAAHRLPLRFILQTANFQSPSKTPATPFI